MKKLVLAGLVGVLGVNLASGVTVTYDGGDGTYPGSGITLPGGYPITATVLDDTATHYLLQLSGGAIDFGSEYGSTHPPQTPPLIGNFWAIAIDDSLNWFGNIDLGLYDEFVANQSDRVDFGDGPTAMLIHTASADQFSNTDFYEIHAGSEPLPYVLNAVNGATTFSLSFTGTTNATSQFLDWTITLEGTRQVSVPDSPLPVTCFGLVLLGLLGVGYRSKLQLGA